METTKENNQIASILFEDKCRAIRHLLLQLIILVIVAGNFFDAPDQLNLSINRIYSGLGYFLFLNTLVYFNAYVLFPCFLAKNKIILYILSVTVFIVFMMLVMMILQDKFYDIAVIHHNPSGMAIFLSITSSLLAISLFLGGVTAFQLIKQWVVSSQHINELKSATTESELIFLKGQINPHFLFNMLNNANILIDEDPDMASYILRRLDELLRYQLNDSTQNKVSLNAEIHFLNNYLELEKTRRDKFEYQIRKEGDMENIRIAPLLFIPFVENAVKHNANYEDNTYVYILFRLQRDTLTFTCRNSIPVKPLPKKGKGGLGLINIHKRLDLLFGNDYLLEQVRTDREYTVKLQINI